MKCTPHLAGLLVLLPIHSSSGEEASPPPAESIDFVVKNSTVHRINVVQPPAIPELPEVRATIDVTVQLVEDPGLPDPQPPPSPPDSGPGGAVVPGVLQGSASEALRLVPLSATWYPREQLSKVYWSYQGRSFQCVSRRNFLHLSGWNGALPDDRTRLLTLGITVEDTVHLAELWRQQGREWSPPVFAAIPEGQDYVLTEGDSADAEGVGAIELVHAKFRNEGPQIEQAWLERQRLEAERKAALLANPPQPQDLKIQVWKRTKTTNSQAR